MKNELFKAILALDAYHRGYRPGLFLAEDKLGVSQVQLGDAQLRSGSDLLGGVPNNSVGLNRDEAVSFFAQSYEWNGQKVISFRGTDDGTLSYKQFIGLWYGNSDSSTGWGIGGGSPRGEQARLAPSSPIAAPMICLFQAPTRTRSMASVSESANRTGRRRRRRLMP